MNENELKSIFISSINSGHIKDNIFSSTIPSEAADSRNIEVRIKDEGYFRNFDLVIAIIEKRYGSDIKKLVSVEDYDDYYNMLMRSSLLSQFANRDKCRIDWIHFYPVEIKSDDDILDERLINQILNAILTFGRSIVVLDEKHSRRIKKLLLHLLPSTIIGYTGKDDYFQVLSVFGRFITTGMFAIPKRRVARFLVENGYYSNKEQAKIYRSLSYIERINQKLAFSQFFDSHDDGNKERNSYGQNSHDLSLDEIDFLRKLTDIDVILSEKKIMMNLIKDTINRKITDYL